MQTGQTILSEGSEEPKYHVRSGDSYVTIERFEKGDMTFGQFREFAYGLNTCGSGKKGDMIHYFTSDRETVQPENKLLHDTEFAGCKHKLTNLMDEVCSWKTYPRATMQIKLVQARWLYKHGNWQAFIGDDGVNYWYLYFLTS